MTHLRQMMLDELQRRNYSPNTVRSYIHAVEDFSKYFRRSPDLLGPDDIRKYQVHLFRDRKLSPGTIEGHTAALRTAGLDYGHIYRAPTAAPVQFRACNAPSQHQTPIENA